MDRRDLSLVLLAAAALSCVSLFPVRAGRAQAPAADGPAQAPAVSARERRPGRVDGGVELPNGWRISPAGKAIAELGDLVTNLTVSPDGRVLVAVHSGYLPHGLDVFDAANHEHLQHIDLRSAWLGVAWSADGATLYVSGGNGTGNKNGEDPSSPIYEFAYRNGRLSESPAGVLTETTDARQVWWSGIAILPGRHRLYAANRTTTDRPGEVVAFDTGTGRIAARIPVEVSPYQVVLAADGRHLLVSNESSDSISVIDTGADRVVRTLRVGASPNDMKLSRDGRLFVACSGENAVYVIDTRTWQVLERLSTTLTPLAPEGSTPDALAVDDARRLLYIANAGNNSIAVVRLADRLHGEVEGFIPTGWYPTALALADQGRTLYIADSKGEQGHPDLEGMDSPLSKSPPRDWQSFRMNQTVFSQASSLEVLPIADLGARLHHWTRQVLEDTPYRDSLLSEAGPPLQPSIVPQSVGVSTPIEHVIYIIKENRTFDQVFGDLPHANGDPRLTIFGERTTPNLHALAREYVTLDNLYCDGVVSYDGHLWATAAYATHFNEKEWPPYYGGHSEPGSAYNVHAMVPSAGYIWDLARRRGLTYRSYGENATRVSTAGRHLVMEAAPGAAGLAGHVSKDYLSGLDVRDSERVAVFLREFREYEAHYDDRDPERRLPSVTVMSLPEDHAVGTAPGRYTPAAMVADNDYAVGQIVDAVSHSRYWPATAIFIIEDDAGNGPDHVDSRRAEGLVISPWVRRGVVDSTLYTTSSMLRTMELLLGLGPMSQYDAAATPMYASFGTTALVTPFDVIRPLIDVNAKNPAGAYGARESSRMDLSEPDRAPMNALNEIIWRSVRGADSPMPPPVNRLRPLIDGSEREDEREPH